MRTSLATLLLAIGLTGCASTPTISPEAEEEPAALDSPQSQAIEDQGIDEQTIKDQALLQMLTGEGPSGSFHTVEPSPDERDFIYGQLTMEYVMDMHESQCPSNGRPVPLRCVSGNEIRSQIESTFILDEEIGPQTLKINYSCRLLSEEHWCLDAQLRLDDGPETIIDSQCQHISEIVEIPTPEGNLDAKLTMAVTAATLPPEPESTEP